MSSSSSESLPGFADRFRVESRLGRGGMGAVYKAWDTLLERTVAVKTLIADDGDPQGVERLLREARACARLAHRGIVAIHDVLQVEGSVYIVMEHLPGASLAALPRPPHFSSLEAKFDVIIRILDALHYAHGRGVVHRDIKPTNVQLLPDGSVRLLDFGIAHITGATAVTATGALTGTAHYASPEQLRGEETDASTDIYSTGILAYEVLTRRRPFDGVSVGTVATKVLQDPLPAMGTWLSESFPEIERIVRRATAKQSRERYATAEEMKGALTAFLASSREAIVARQAEVAASSDRLIGEARSLIANARTAEAIPLLTSVLRSNPDADEARRLLRAAHGGAVVSGLPSPAPGAPAAPQTETASMGRAGPVEATNVSPAVPATASNSPWGRRRLAVAAASVLVLLIGAALLGPFWPPGADPAATSPLEPQTERLAANLDAPGPTAAASSSPQPPAAPVVAGPAMSGSEAPGPSSAASSGERSSGPSPISEMPAAESSETAPPRRENAGDGPRSSETAGASGSTAVSAAPAAEWSETALPRTGHAGDGPRSSAGETAGASGSAAVSAAPAAGATSALSADAPPAPEPPAPEPEPLASAKNLYYAATSPGRAARASEEMPPAAVVGAPNAGLKVRILRRGPEGDAVEVDADTLFQSGDRIRFGFEPNVDGFLYVIQRGSSGRWSVLLPHPMIDAGANEVTRFDEVTVPPEGWFRFDENPGAEQVFVYLSRDPLDALPWGGGAVASPQSLDEPTVVELANSVRSRDLMFEMERAPGDADRAAYVVNQDDAGSAVAWTLELRRR